MQRLKVTFRREARADLADIFKSVLDMSKSVGIDRSFVLRIRDRCERIGNVPFGGRPRDDLETGLRTVPFEKSAVIAYKVENDRVRIINIFYGGRDFEALYRGAPPDDEGA
jgi:toxin ParE1/3/4